MVEALFFLLDKPEAKKLRAQYPLKEVLLKLPDQKEDEHPILTLVLYFNKAAIATGNLREIDPETYEVLAIAVDKNLIGKGIGKNTVKFLLTKIKAMGGRKAVVDCPIDLLDFFYKCGFASKDGEISSEKGEPTIRLEKALIKPRPGRF